MQGHSYSRKKLKIGRRVGCCYGTARRRLGAVVRGRGVAMVRARHAYYPATPLMTPSFHERPASQRCVHITTPTRPRSIPSPRTCVPPITAPTAHFLDSLRLSPPPDETLLYSQSFPRVSSAHRPAPRAPGPPPSSRTCRILGERLRPRVRPEGGDTAFGP